MDDLVATSWTHAGDAAPMRRHERSPRDILERVYAAADAGFAGFGIVHADLVRARDTIGWDELDREIRESGFRHVEVEFLTDWWTNGRRRMGSDRKRRELLDAAVALGAGVVKVSGSTRDHPDHALLVDAFGALCDDATASGTRIALEPMPFTNFRTVPEGARFVAEVGHPAGGLVVDVGHVYRAGQLPNDLRDTVDGERVFVVELDDSRGAPPAPEDAFADTIEHGLPPGEGEWDLPGFVTVLPGLGFAGPWGVEVISDEQRARDLADGLHRAYAAGRAVLERADHSHAARV